MDDEHLRWAEALAIERWQGTNAVCWTADQIETLALAGDEAGAKRFRAIARRQEELPAARLKPQ